MSEWKPLNTILDVAAAKTAGMEIEVYDTDVEDWVPWQGIYWFSDWNFRARPRKPKTVKVKSLCWRGKGTGHLVWWDALANPGEGFVRFPAGDISGDVEA